MTIVHVFHTLNAFGGAEEHLTTLASLQRAQGDAVSVCLVRAADRDNQYFCRLRAAGVGVWQWPLWISRVTGDWNTTETILRHVVVVLRPAIAIVARCAAMARKSPVREMRRSVEGRVRTMCGRALRQERQLFTRLLDWHHIWQRPDVLHLHSYGGALDFVVRWCRTRGLPVVYQEHSTPDRTVRRTYALPGRLDSASLVVGVSEASATALRHVCGVTCPIRVIPPIVALPDALANRETRARKGTAHVVTIARLSEEKGLDCLIRAAEKVLERRPQVTFAIHGEGHLRSALTAQIERSALAAAVRLNHAFARQDLPAILTGADILVLPSLTEGYPLCLVEAMASGLPIVATSVGGVPELVKHGVTGLLCPPGDAEALAGALAALIDDPDRALALGAAAREYYGTTLKPERVVRLFADAYADARALATRAAS